VVVTVQPGQRFGAVDVHYPEAGGACAALIVAADVRFADIIAQHTAWLQSAARYQPGRFYLRELPAIAAVLATTGCLDLLIIDGYVDLDPHGRPGLGARLHTQINVPVIGVAKTAFRSATHAIALQRGRATRPVFVTAIGLPRDRAAALVAEMAGPYRMPDALRRVDALARHGRRG
jgi:deoxyribonuclease V